MIFMVRLFSTIDHKHKTALLLCSLVLKFHVLTTKLQDPDNKCQRLDVARPDTSAKKTP